MEQVGACAGQHNHTRYTVKLAELDLPSIGPKLAKRPWEVDAEATSAAFEISSSALRFLLRRIEGGGTRDDFLRMLLAWGTNGTSACEFSCPGFLADGRSLNNDMTGTRSVTTVCTQFVPAMGKYMYSID